jgi:hypothetical protein
MSVADDIDNPPDANAANNIEKKADFSWSRVYVAVVLVTVVVIALLWMFSRYFSS